MTTNRTVLGKTALYLFPGTALTVIAATWLLHVIDPLSHRLSYQQTDISIGGHTIRVELADTPAKIQRGLMYRESLGQDSGMLFVYPAKKHLKFWMKDTSIPLSLAYIGNDCRILEIRQLQPHSTDTTRSNSPARLVLEMNQGWFDRNQVEVGDTIVLPLSMGVCKLGISYSRTPFDLV